MKKEEEALVYEAYQFSKIDGISWDQAMKLGKKERKYIHGFIKKEQQKSK